MIDVARIDHWAAHGSSAVHRASVPAKLLFVFGVVAAAVAASSITPLAAGTGLLIAVAAAAGLPWIRMLLLSLYAAFFAGLYALSLHGGTAVVVLLLLKAVMPAYAVGMLIVSTPYPRIFATLSAVMPEILASGLFMTYRTFFILLDMMHHFAMALRLRGGMGPGEIVRNGSNIAKGVGALLIRAVDRSSRLYAVMTVRGYAGKMAERASWSFSGSDWLPLGAGGAVLLLAITL